MQRHFYVATLAASAIFLAACVTVPPVAEAAKQEPAAKPEAAKPKGADPSLFLTQPLDVDIYTADPSAHVYNGRIYIMPSHDIDAGVKNDASGAQFAMVDYHVLSMDRIGGPVTKHDVALHVKDVPWATERMWAPDMQEKDGKYYLYFPAYDKQGVFRIGVALSDKPEGPYTAQPEPIKGSFSMDPAVFKDDDGKYYMYFGGLWGGQLQQWKSGKHDPKDESQPPDDQPALYPKVARMADNMLEFAEKPKDLKILDENGKPILSGDHERRFFEAAWLHKHDGKYYFSYSTGDTHFIAYAIGDSPYGPFTYKGNILGPVLGWTNHHSIVEVDGKTYLFYHDSQRSNGVTHLRNVKEPIELTYNPDGTIQYVDPYKGDDAPQ